MYLYARILEECGCPVVWRLTMRSLPAFDMEILLPGVHRYLPPPVANSVFELGNDRVYAYPHCLLWLLEQKL